MSTDGTANDNTMSQPATNESPFDLNKLVDIMVERFKLARAREWAGSALEQDKVDVAGGRAPIYTARERRRMIRVGKLTLAALQAEEDEAIRNGRAWDQVTRDLRRNQLRHQIWSRRSVHRGKVQMKPARPWPLPRRLRGIYDKSKGWTEELEVEQWRYHGDQILDNFDALMSWSKEDWRVQREAFARDINETFEEAFTGLYAWHFNGREDLRDVAFTNKLFRELEDAHTMDCEKREGRLPDRAELDEMADGKATAKAMWAVNRKWALDICSIMNAARRADAENHGYQVERESEQRQKMHDDLLAEIDRLAKESEVAHQTSSQSDVRQPASTVIIHNEITRVVNIHKTEVKIEGSTSSVDLPAETKGQIADLTQAARASIEAQRLLLKAKLVVDLPAATKKDIRNLSVAVARTEEALDRLQKAEDGSPKMTDFTIAEIDAKTIRVSWVHPEHGRRAVAITGESRKIFITTLRSTRDFSATTRDLDRAIHAQSRTQRPVGRTYKKMFQLNPEYAMFWSEVVLNLPRSQKYKLKIFVP